MNIKQGSESKVASIAKVREIFEEDRRRYIEITGRRTEERRIIK